MRFLLRGSLTASLVLGGCSEDANDAGVQLVDAGFVNEVSTKPDSGAPDTAATDTAVSETETSTDTRADDAQPEADTPPTD